MKKLLATTAVAMMAIASAASAQSVLERVLTKIDNSTNLAAVNGTFANIAENIGGSSVVTMYIDPTADVVISEEAYNALVAEQTAADLTAALATLTVSGYRTTAPDASSFDLTTSAGQNAYNTEVGLYQAYVDAIATSKVTGPTAVAAIYTDTEQVAVAGLAGVNGSINNTIEGVTASIVTASQVATAGTTIAYEFDLPTYTLGALSTTALGAVNTGTITLGVNSAVDDAKTTSTQAVSTVMNQLGGSADTGALVLNVASNMTGVNGSINNTMNNVNGSVTSASTTALGAVNTGVITSGVNAAVQGIVGTSGQANGIAPK
jgi:hypothetical protein